MTLFKVEQVFDGDSFLVTGWNWAGKEGKGVRIANIDAPERGEPGYEEAKRRLTQLILGKMVGLDTKAIDKYGRLVADVYVDGLINVVDILTARTR